VRGKGTLVSARSGALINEQPLMTLELEVDVPGHAPRPAEADRLRLRRPPQPGLVLPVYVDPRDPDDILVVW